MDFGLSGRVALVAAASRGLGRAAAEELAAEGAAVVICARGEERLRVAAEAIREGTGSDVLAVPADLTDGASVDALLETALGWRGRVDVLVTNSGGPPSGSFGSHSLEAWRAAVRLLLESAIRLVRGVLPGMRERGWGRIVNVTSIAVKQPVDGLILSNSVRAAVTGLARTLANEVAAEGVTVNNVLPGYTLTDRVEELAEQQARAEGISKEEAFRGWEEEIPMGRLAEPREFAALVAFLASERAGYITGASIPVDGGWIRSLL